MMTYKDYYPQIPGKLHPSDPIFKELNIPKVHDVIKMQVVVFIFNCLNYNSPTNFWSWFILKHTVHSYQTRSCSVFNMNSNNEITSVTCSNILHTQCSKLSRYGAKMLRVLGPLIWNRLPDIRYSNSLSK